MKSIVSLILVALIAGGVWWYQNQPSGGTTAVEPFPTITIEQIFATSDFSNGVKQAVINNNPQAVDEWLEKALHVAEQAQLDAETLDYIQSPRAHDYVVFVAKRQLFSEAFEARYYDLQDIDSLKAKYPEAEDLFPRADTLITQRDQTIQEVAKTLSEGKAVDEATLAYAKKLWRERFSEQQGVTLSSDK